MKRLVVISTPYFFENEGSILSSLFDEGLECLHLRKPECREVELRQLLETIPERYYSRIRLHDCFELSRTFPVGGLHLNRRNSSVPNGYKGAISRSCHSLQEVADSAGFDYVFLSPLFQSISKEGYGSGFSLQTLEKASEAGLINEKVIALGGMDRTTIPLIRHLNFGGVAVLGALWGEATENKKLPNIRKRFKDLQI